MKSVDEIRASLDRRGRVESVDFFPEMKRFANGRYQVLRRIEDLGVRLPWWKLPKGNWFSLDKVRCSGEPFVDDGGCDCNCAFMWHESWLDMENVGGEG